MEPRNPERALGRPITPNVHFNFSWLLLAPSGSSWLLLAPPGSFWLFLAPPGPLGPLGVSKNPLQLLEASRDSWKGPKWNPKNPGGPRRAQEKP